MSNTWQAGLIGWLQTPAGITPTGAAWRARQGAPFTRASPEQRGFGGKRIVIAAARRAGWLDGAGVR